MNPNLGKISRRPRLSEGVCAELERRIRSGEYAPGGQLPTEKLLSESFAVSRAVVREAIARLKADGLIESRQGSGAFVTARPKSLNFKVPEAEEARRNLEHVFELRTLVEMTVAEMAARRRTEADLEAIGRQLELMDQALAADKDGSVADDAFHEAIAAAAHNPLVQRFLEFLGHHFSESRRHLPWVGSGRSRSGLEIAQAEHREMFKAIAESAPARARQVAHDHLCGAAERLGLHLAGDLGGKEGTVDWI